MFLQSKVEGHIPSLARGRARISQAEPSPSSSGKMRYRCVCHLVEVVRGGAEAESEGMGIISFQKSTFNIYIYIYIHIAKWCTSGFLTSARVESRPVRGYSRRNYRSCIVRFALPTSASISRILLVGFEVWVH